MRRVKSPCIDVTGESSEDDEIIEIEGDQAMECHSEPSMRTGESQSRKRKQGRPPTTGEYVGLAEAKKALNDEKREEERLEREKKFRMMLNEDLLETTGLDLNEAIAEMRQGPTADIANRAREGMMEIIRVAKVSSNIKGELRKHLKTAALSATAVVEVDPADCPFDSDIPRQMRALKEELEKAKNEAVKTSKEMERLRKEIAKLRGEKERKSRKTYVVDSSSTSVSSSPERTLKKVKSKKGKGTNPRNKREERPNPEDMAGAVEMEVDSTPVPLAPRPPPITFGEGDDEKRRKEILPPKEEWPPIIRPALKGKVKIIEDRPLEGHTIRIVSDKEEGKSKVENTAQRSATEKKGEVHSLMEKLTPLLNKWLQDNVAPSGFTRTKGQAEGKREDPKKRENKRKDAKDKSFSSQPTKHREDNPKPKEGVKPGTTVPNSELWTTVLGRKERKEGKKAKAKPAETKKDAKKPPTGENPCQKGGREGDSQELRRSQ